MVLHRDSHHESCRGRLPGAVPAKTLTAADSRCVTGYVASVLGILPMLIASGTSAATVVVNGAFVPSAVGGGDWLLQEGGGVNALLQEGGGGNVLLQE